MLYKDRRPVVIMPEGSKTNGVGILNIDMEISKIISAAADAENNMRVHSIRFDHQFSYYSAYNSTDSLGIRSIIGCCS